MPWPRWTQCKTAIVYWTGLVGGVASILSFVGGFFTSNEWYVRYIAYSSTVYIVALIFIQTYLLIQRSSLLSDLQRLDGARKTAEERAAQAEAYREVFQPMHSLFHKLRDIVFRLHRQPPKPEDAYDEAFCQHILNITQTIYERVSGVTCSTCIKIFDGNQERVSTLVRDSRSAANRGEYDHKRVSRLSDNSDFAIIVQGTERYFLCNDLLELSRAGRYKNDRVDWERHYNSALVLPIRCYDKSLEKYQLFGFLCIDSMAAEVFDPRISPEIGACIADMVYVYFDVVDRLRH